MWAKLVGAAGCMLGLASAGFGQPLTPPAVAQPGSGGAFGQPGYGGGFGQPGYGGGSGAFSPNAGPFAPNPYNPQTQPLSPYLNLLRGSNPATNYYYGVRPGTVGGRGGIGGGSPNIAAGGNRAAFFPQLAYGPDPFSTPDPETGAGANVLPPAGHPVVFQNTLGYFPGSVGRGSRPGLSGVGNTRPAGRR